MELVHYEIEDRICTLTLDSQPNRNALSRQLLRELSEGLELAEADADVRVVLIRHRGPVFCSGADLKEAVGGDATESPLAMVGLQRRIVALSKPVVVRLCGAVRAGGIGLVGAADVVVSADDTSFALTEVRLGLAPAVISLTLLPRMDPRSAQYAFLSGEAFTASQAAECGLVTIAVPEADLDAHVSRVCRALAEGDPQGLRETKLLLNADLIRAMDTQGPELAERSARLFQSEAAQAAMLAFGTRK